MDMRKKIVMINISNSCMQISCYATWLKVSHSFSAFWMLIEVIHCVEGCFFIDEFKAIEIADVEEFLNLLLTTQFFSD